MPAHASAPSEPASLEPSDSGRSLYSRGRDVASSSNRPSAQPSMTLGHQHRS
jgi:hypothetical protein